MSKAPRTATWNPCDSFLDPLANGIEAFIDGLSELGEVDDAGSEAQCLYWHHVGRRVFPDEFNWIQGHAWLLVHVGPHVGERLKRILREFDKDFQKSIPQMSGTRSPSADEGDEQEVDRRDVTLTFLMHRCSLAAEEIRAISRAVDPLMKGREIKIELQPEIPAAQRELQTSIDEKNRTLTRRGKIAEFEGDGKAWAMVCELLKAYPEPVLRERIFDTVWAGEAVTPNNLEQQSRTARKKLKPIGLTIQKSGTPTDPKWWLKPIDPSDIDIGF